MTEDEAQQWIADRFGHFAVDRVKKFLARVIEENSVQNLISPASIPHIWTRHAADSAQLLHLAPATWSSWLDVGTGGGFPGMVVALLAPDRVVRMIEPRARRAAFLSDCIVRYGLRHASVEQLKVQAATGCSNVISARAVASMEDLLRDAGHCAAADTVWLLPRGRSGMNEAASASKMFHVEHRVTDRGSYILIGKGRPE